MNRDSDRPARPEAGGERHAVSITRMCLRSGSVQLPFALAGRLPQGELLVHDSERDEAIVLWSDPPRTLSGLGPLFETHELQVNDQLVLELQGHDLRLGIRKRPRRTRPQVTPSTWESHRLDDGPRRDDPDAAPAATEGAEGPDRFDAGREGDPYGGAADEADAFGGHDAGDQGSAAHDGTGGRDPGAYDAYGSDPYADDPYDDAPHAPRVRVSPLPNDAAGVREAGRRTPSSAPAGARRSADEGDAGGWLGGVWRTARSWLGGGREPRSDDAPPVASERDWTDAWDEADDTTSVDPLARGRGAPDDEGRGAADAGRGADGPPDDGYVFDYDEAAFDDAPPPEGRRTEPRRAEPRGGGPRHAGSPRPEPAESRPRAGGIRDVELPEPEARRRDAPGAEPRPLATDDGAFDEETVDLLDPSVADAAGDAADGRGATVDTGARPEPSTPSPAPAEAAEPADVGPPAGDPDRPEDPAARAAAWQPERGVPSRAERFLAGDLRTRLLRFLTSPDMPLIAKSEMIASRFDLTEETARDMLADIADDPPPGIRLTPVREGAWRIERSGRA